ncbi:MAG: fimbrial protein [Rhodanobacteraceae bacterium]
MNMRSDIERGENPVSGGSAPAWHLSSRTLVTLLGCLLLLGLVCIPRTARAVCWFTNGSATTVTFNAGTITLTPSTQIGAVLWTSSTSSPANPPVLDCDRDTNGGIVNTIAGSPTGGDNTLFPTGIPGVSYRILHPDASNPLKVYPDYPTGSGTFSVQSNLQLVYTGPFLPPNNSTLTGQLSQWKIDICDDPDFHKGNHRRCGSKHNPQPVIPQPVETFNISATILIQVPTCDIETSSVNKTVTLPNVSTQQFTGQGSTADKTPFSLQLINCPKNLGVSITLDTSNPQPGAAGVIAPSGAGYASGIGIQILQDDGINPVVFGTPISTGTTSASNYAINLFASYYQTGPTVSAGTVKAIATYTLNYQ